MPMTPSANFTKTTTSSALFLLFLITYISSCGLGECTTAHGREGGGAQDNFQLIITQLMMTTQLMIITQLMMITQYDDDDDDDNTVC